MNIGDVVYLKSGGPPMTIIALNGDATAQCYWTGGNMALPLACLIADNPTYALSKRNRELEKANADPIEAVPK